MNKEQKSKINEHRTLNGSPAINALGVLVSELLNNEGKLPAFYAEINGNMVVALDIERVRMLPFDIFHELVSSILGKMLVTIGFGVSFTAGIRMTFDANGGFKPVGFGIGVTDERLSKYPITNRSIDYLDEHARDVLAKLAGALMHADIKREEYEP